MAQANQNGSFNSNGIYSHVVGWGVEIPERIMTNVDLEKIVDTDDMWIRERTGIEARRIADEKDTCATLGFRAARKALQHADVLPSEIDQIIVATSSPTHFFPSVACQIQDLLGAKNAGAFDVLAACTGFIYGMSLASSQIKAGEIKTALVIGTETLSRIVDWSDRGTCILFGDGAGAFVIQARETPGGIQSVVLHSDGSGGNMLATTSGIRDDWDSPMHQRAVNTTMNGREVFRFASRIIGSATNEVLENVGLTTDDIDLIIPHQANLRIIQAAARNLKMPMDRFFVNLQKYGNTSTASIPIAVAEAAEEGAINPDDKIVLVGFGGGLTWGALVMDWDVQEVSPTQMRELIREGSYIVARIRYFWVRFARYFIASISGSPTGRVVRKETRKNKRNKDKE